MVSTARRRLLIWVAGGVACASVVLILTSQRHQVLRKQEVGAGFGHDPQNPYIKQNDIRRELPTSGPAAY